ncbi:hypothetical protein BGZ76_011361 [Entomortierella beljakovae]|nr:hypothetical protein BGZ76_011361 [Entomortierella beljakovae]
MKQLPLWARRVVDAERMRRSKQGSKNPTKSEKSRILDIGEDNANEQVQQDEVELEVDGAFLHDHVTDEASYNLTYNINLNPNKERSLSVLGHFICGTPRCKNRKWTSGIVATVLEYSSYNSSYKTTIHAQRCARCEEYAEPNVDATAYASRVVHTIDLWKGLRERSNLTYDGPDGPHDEGRCHACEINKCPWKMKSFSVKASDKHRARPLMWTS